MPLEPKPKIPAIILARGGSERIRRKNLLPWLGRPLVQHAAEQCLATPGVSFVIVASDDQVILEAAQDAGKYAEAVNKQLMLYMRQPASPEQTSLEALWETMTAMGLDASFVLLAQCTSPYINPQDLQKLIDAWRLRWESQYWLSQGEVSGPVVPQSGAEAASPPTGMGYIYAPHVCHDDRKPRYVQVLKQEAPVFDVDDPQDFQRAVASLTQYKQLFQGVSDVLTQHGLQVLPGGKATYRK